MRRLTSSNFSWLIDGLLAGSGFPSSQAHYDFYKSQGVTYVVNLTQNKPDPSINTSGLEVLPISMPDFTPPSMTQIEQFVQFVDDAKAKKQSLVCHCQWGQGRTGTMLAAYLVRQGTTPDEAIKRVRHMRPRSIETMEQEQSVFEYAEHIKAVRTN